MVLRDLETLLHRTQKMEFGWVFYCSETGSSWYLTFSSAQAVTWSSINNEISGILIECYSFQRTVGTFYMKRFSTEVKNFIDMNVDEALIKNNRNVTVFIRQVNFFNGLRTILGAYFLGHLEIRYSFCIS